MRDKYPMPHLRGNVKTKLRIEMFVCYTAIKEVGSEVLSTAGHYFAP